MTLSADNDLKLYVKKKSREGWLSILISLPGIALLGAGFYLNSSSSLEFAIIFAPVIVIFGYLIYANGFKIGKVINQIISEILVEEKTVKIKTFGYTFFFVTYPSIEKTISKHDLAFTDIDFPLYKKELAKNDSYCLGIEKEQYYLIYKHYPNDLMQILSVNKEL